MRENGETVPYSIDLSERLCSCCLELYNVLGRKFRKKLVRPCLGALFFARMERDRYYEVIALGSGTAEPAGATVQDGGDT